MAAADAQLVPNEQGALGQNHGVNQGCTGLNMVGEELY